MIEGKQTFFCCFKLQSASNTGCKKTQKQQKPTHTKNQTKKPTQPETVVKNVVILSHVCLVISTSLKQLTQINVYFKRGKH